MTSPPKVEGLTKPFQGVIALRGAGVMHEAAHLVASGGDKPGGPALLFIFTSCRRRNAGDFAATPDGRARPPLRGADLKRRDRRNGNATHALNRRRRERRSRRQAIGAAETDEMRIDDLRAAHEVIGPRGADGAWPCSRWRGSERRGWRASAATASEIIERRDLAAMELARASHLMAAAPHAVFAILLYDQDESAARGVEEGVPRLSSTESVALLDHAATLLPDRAADIAKFKKRFQTARRRREGRPSRSASARPACSTGLAIQERPISRPGGARRKARHRNRHAHRRSDQQT